ncbi:MAG: hypothetical protein H0W73_08680 [Bacteroidetes bacterium]|nr:hypothetical protein [Bacteroidota bacterium]
MKPIIVFYSVCILMFYSLILYIGNRNKNYKSERSGLLEDVTVSASEYKISKAKVLSQNFDNAIVYCKMKQPKMASDEIYKAIILLANHVGDSEDYANTTLNDILKDLSICYIDLAKHNSTELNMNKIFESSELFIAYGYIQRSKNEIKKSKIYDALENISKAQECLALSAKYVDGEGLKTHNRLLDETNDLLTIITPQSK